MPGLSGHWEKLKRLGPARRLSETRFAELLRLVPVESLNEKFSCHQSERIDPYLRRHCLKGSCFLEKVIIHDDQ